MNDVTVMLRGAVGRDRRHARSARIGPTLLAILLLAGALLMASCAAPPPTPAVASDQTNEVAERRRDVGDGAREVVGVSGSRAQEDE
jgi:hypothetical protein